MAMSRSRIRMLWHYPQVYILEPSFPSNQTPIPGLRPGTSLSFPEVPWKSELQVLPLPTMLLQKLSSGISLLITSAVTLLAMGVLEVPISRVPPEKTMMSPVLNLVLEFGLKESLAPGYIPEDNATAF